MKYNEAFFCRRRRVRLWFWIYTYMFEKMHAKLDDGGRSKSILWRSIYGTEIE